MERRRASISVNIPNGVEIRNIPVVERGCQSDFVEI